MFAVQHPNIVSNVLAWRWWDRRERFDGRDVYWFHRIRTVPAHQDLNNWRARKLAPRKHGTLALVIMVRI